jgi:hypothetical protein
VGEYLVIAALEPLAAAQRERIRTQMVRAAQLQRLLQLEASHTNTHERQKKQQTN